MNKYNEPKPGILSHCPECKVGAAHYTYPGSVCLACKPVHCTVCGEASGGTPTSSVYGSVHKYGPTTHAFKPSR